MRTVSLYNFSRAVPGETLTSMFPMIRGEHHLCASWQAVVAFGAHETSAAAHFIAEPGQAYYFRVRNTWLRERGVTHVELAPLDKRRRPTAH